MKEINHIETLLIGIDAGCLPVFERLFEEGRAPNLESLCEEGLSVPLESQIPPWTPSAWPSLYTGMNPGKHGATGFVGYDGYDWHVTSRADVDGHALWTLLDHHDITSVVVNVPITSPPDKFDGALVPGFIGPEDPDCHPSGLLADIRDEIGDYRVYPNYTRGDENVPDDEKMAEYQRLIQMRGEAFTYLADQFDPEFGFVQFQKTDTVFHEFEGEKAKVDAVYEATDEQIGHILTECDPNQVFLASDHGMGEYSGYEFRVNEFLRDEGYVEVTASGKGMPSWTPIRHDLQEGNEVETWEPGLVDKVAARAAQFGLTARRARIILEKVGLAEFAIKHAPGKISRTANEQVDFENSIAYMRARTELGVRLNLDGREPHGVVSPEEYNEVQADIIEALEAVTTPDGEPVFEEVAPREQYFDGEHVEKTVDIVTVPAEFDQFLSEQLMGEYFGPVEPWNHKLEGIFVAVGDGIDTDVPIDRAHLFDVAPTILSAMGVPYSDRMDGTSLPIIPDAGSETYPAFRSSDQTNLVEETDEVTDRLADLGYME